MGYQYDAKIKSEECGIPTPPFEGAMDDYIKIISQLMSYLRSSSNSSVDDSMPPFYAMPDDIKSIKNFLEQLCQTAGIYFVSDFFNIFKLFRLLLILHIFFVKMANFLK